MGAINKQLTVLSELEKAALYERPSFNHQQRSEYFTLTDKELQLALSRQNLSSKIHCILQIGYFKAVKMFYRITLGSIDPEDYAFIIRQYFDNQKPEQDNISKYEYYTQIKSITEFFEYKLWSGFYQKLLQAYAVKIVARDINPQFITMELLSYLQTQKVIRPGYTTLQTVVSSVINAERKRLSSIIREYLTIEDKELLQILLIEEGTLSKLAAVKQDAKNFKLKMMEQERQKMLTLKPIYLTVKRLIPYLKLSGQNMHYYANLINYYNIYDLRKKLKIEQTYLYLLCYTWKRYQQINDNLVDAFCYHFKQIDKKIKERADTKFSEHVISERDESHKLKLLARLYVDETLPDEIIFGIVRQKAFSILSKDELLIKLSDAVPNDESVFYWQFVDTAKRIIRLNLHYLAISLDFCCINRQNSYFIAVDWLKTELPKFQKSILSITDCPANTVPKKLRQYLISIGDDKSSLVL